MATLNVVDRSGREHQVAADAGMKMSVMEIIRDSGLDEILAICGGCCSCSTCHIYVDQKFAGKLPPMSADEADLLEGSDNRADTSRLSCQIRFTNEMDGLQVTVAPED